MPEPTTVAASSPVETPDVFNGETPTLAEFNSYRDTGEVPERFKPAATVDSATTDAPEETEEETEGDEPESEPESEPDETQEQEKGSEPGLEAKKRIKQLLAKNKELEARLAAKPDVIKESSTMQPPPQNGKPTPDDKNADGTPKYATYEDFTEAVIDWKTDQKVARLRAEQVEQEALKALSTKMEEAQSRYEDADEVIFPAAKTISESRIPQAVKEVFAGSDVFVDLCYVVGSDPDELEKFVKLAAKDPRAAIGKVFEYERGIKEELAKGKSESKEAPETKRTSAPPPPKPVGGGSSRAFDVNDESLSPEQWMQKRNASLSRKG